MFNSTLKESVRYPFYTVNVTITPATRKCGARPNYITLYVYLYPISSFVELVPYILKQPGVKYFLSDKICQDPLEKILSCQRQ